MQSKLLSFSWCIPALLLIFVVASSSAQAVYSASEDRPVLSAGAGFSIFSQDWGPNPHAMGVTYTVDYHPPIMRGFLSDLNIEVQGRDLLWHRGSVTTTSEPVLTHTNAVSTTVPIVPRTDIIGGGLIYHPHWFRFHRFEPYAKGLVSYGSIDFTSSNPNYTHDTRTVTSVGGGVDYRVMHRITLRGDYEYQWWPDFLGPNSLTPHGFTFGALYSIGHR
jgi:opacity protein-like surface antigen